MRAGTKPDAVKSTNSQCGATDGTTSLLVLGKVTQQSSDDASGLSLLESKAVGVYKRRVSSIDDDDGSSTSAIRSRVGSATSSITALSSAAASSAAGAALELAGGAKNYFDGFVESSSKPFTCNIL